MKARFIKQGAFLAPYDTESEEWLEKKTDGKFFEVEIKSPRNYRFHKKFFALLCISYPYWTPPKIQSPIDGSDILGNEELFREKVLIAAGHCEWVINHKNQPVLKAKSISYDALPTDDIFEPVYSACVDVVIQKVLIGYTIEEVDRLVGNFL